METRKLSLMFEDTYTSVYQHTAKYVFLVLQEKYTYNVRIKNRNLSL
jgi:hypothetical protein